MVYVVDDYAAIALRMQRIESGNADIDATKTEEPPKPLLFYLERHFGWLDLTAQEIKDWVGDGAVGRSSQEFYTGP